MKYIVFDHPTLDFMPVIFPNYMNHDDMGKAISRLRYHPISAGFVLTNHDGTVVASGRSESLNLDADVERDTKLLNRLLSR